MRKVILLVVLMSLLFSFECKKLFTFKVVNDMLLKDVLTQIALECNLNIIPLDEEASKRLNSTINFINFKNATLKEVLTTLFETKNLFFSIKNNKVFISYYKTKTFSLNYISNNISGSSGVSDTNSNLKSNYTFDFWDNLETDIDNLLKNSDTFYKKPIVDKNSGLITVTGTKKQLEEVEKYINKIKKELNKEVLIDVKIYSVELSKSHKTGIDWSKLSISLPNSSVPLRASYIVGSQSIFNSATFNAEAFLNFLAQYGNVNSISNPKIVTLNNQKAIISIGDTIYYKYVANVVVTDNQPTQTQYTIGSKFVGVLLDITPQISDSGEIVLNINPRISAFRDPTQISSTTTRDMPPDTKDNTLMSVVKLKDNQTLVLGGLITSDISLKVNGVPVLKEIPLIKYLFSSREKITNKKELVFVITPHIIKFSKHKSLKDLGFSKLPSLEDINE